MLSKDIPLGGYRQILTWPLVMRLSENLQNERARSTDRKVRDEMQKVIAALEHDNARWTEIPDLLDHLPLESADDRRVAYAEFVYFHDFLQSVLFRQQETEPDKAEIRLFKRIDLGKIEMEISISDVKSITASAKIERCNLYLLATGTAILALELDYEHAVTENGKHRPLSLADAMTINDHLRRVYAPFFWNANSPAYIPLGMRIYDTNNQLVSTLDHDNVEKAAPTVLDVYLSENGGVLRTPDLSGRRTPPVLNVWRDLVHPLRLAGYSRTGDEHCWRHVVDERIPVMSHVSLTSETTKAQKQNTTAEYDSQRRDFWHVSDADMMRLCFADAAGTDLSPYNPKFLEGFEAKHCYDRFLPHTDTTSASRIMFAGYHTCFVGAGSFFDTHLKTHFRRHYFQMALLTQIEFVSLLAISSRISDAVARFRREKNGELKKAVTARKAFQDEILEIQRDFLEFVHLYRFSAVSNQIQALEIFDKWRQSLALQTIYDDVRVELEAATNYVLGFDNKEQAEASNWLGTIATIGLVLSIIFSALGLNVFLDGKTVELLTSIPNGASGLAVFKQAGFGFHFAILGIVTIAISAGGKWVLGQYARGEADPTTAVARRVVAGFLKGGWLLIAAAAAWFVLGAQPAEDSRQKTGAGDPVPAQCCLQQPPKSPAPANPHPTSSPEPPPPKP